MKKILAIKAGGIGDVLLTLPALRALKKGYRPCSVTLVCPPAIHPLMDGIVDTCMDINGGFIAQWMGPDPGREMAAFFRDYDLIVSWFGYWDKEFRSNVELVAPGRCLFIESYPPRGGLPHKISIHASDWNLLSLLNIDIPDDLVYSSEAKTISLPSIKRRVNLGSPVHAIHPGSGAWYKNWPPEFFAGLAERILKYDRRQRIALIEGPADAEAVGAVRRLLPEKRVEIMHTSSLLSLAEFLAGCFMYAGNDSGVSHLAGAVGCPTLVFYGPTDPRMWGILREDASIQWKGLPCSPCSRDTAVRCTHRRCLWGITVDEVWGPSSSHGKT